MASSVLLRQFAAATALATSIGLRAIHFIRFMGIFLPVENKYWEEVRKRVDRMTFAEETGNSSRVKQVVAQLNGGPRRLARPV